jgi:hypothetical protein
MKNKPDFEPWNYAEREVDATWRYMGWIALWLTVIIFLLYLLVT